MSTFKKKAFFLDRDGIINIDVKYLYKIRELKFVEGIFDLCRYIQSKGYLIVVVTNQAGISRGYYTEQDMEELHDYIKNQFNENGIKIDKFYHCPHHPDFSGECDCRKPNIGMIKKAEEELEIELNESYLLGDKMSDAYTGKNAKLKSSYLLQGNYELKKNEFEIFRDLREFLKYLKDKEEF